MYTDRAGAAGQHIDRCVHTGITKPECHCTACLAALVAAHAPRRPASARG